MPHPAPRPRTTPRSRPAAPPPDPREGLHADCSRCAALCCVVLPFTRSADFPVDKAAGVPCGHLQADHRCGIHDRLPAAGYRGCVAYDCLGAGQRTTQQVFGGADWRDDPALLGPMAAVLGVLHRLHELRWHLLDAVGRPTLGPGELRDELTRHLDEVGALGDLPADDLRALDLEPRHAVVGELLGRASATVRSAVRPRPRVLRGADLVGARRRGADLRAADLRGALLLGADLREADLRHADLLGADLRGADVRGADLTDALFLLPGQVAGARGDAATRLPDPLTAPGGWAAA